MRHMPIALDLAAVWDDIQAFIQGAGDFLAGPPDISFWNAA